MIDLSISQMSQLRLDITPRRYQVLHMFICFEIRHLDSFVLKLTELAKWSLVFIYWL